MSFGFVAIPARLGPCFNADDTPLALPGPAMPSVKKIVKHPSEDVDVDLLHCPSNGLALIARMRGKELAANMRKQRGGRKEASVVFNRQADEDDLLVPPRLEF